MSLSELDSLQNTLNASIDAIKEEIKNSGYPELSTFATAPHPLDEAENLPSQRLFEARNTAIAALSRLEILLQNPYQRANQQIYAVYETASLDIAVKTGLVDTLSNIPDISRGLHVRELQEKLDMDAVKLTIILRLLATKGWFHETSEGVFAVTRPALQLKEGQNGWKAVLTPGKPRVAASLPDLVTHPKWKYSQSPKETAYQLAFDTDSIMFEHVYRNPSVASLFTHSVRSLGDEFSPGVLSDYPWNGLDGRTIVDCGGGQGSMTLLLIPKLPNSTFVIQDFAGPLAVAKANLQSTFPEAWKAGRIALQEHNFFDPQPQTGSNHIFLFRWILHDWPDDQVVQILSQAAKAGGKGSKVLIIEFVVVPGLVNTAAPVVSEDGIVVPPFIPADFAQVSTIVHDMGIHMMAALNARERTLTEYEHLISRSGMKVSKLYRLRSPLSVIEVEVI